MKRRTARWNLATLAASAFFLHATSAFGQGAGTWRVVVARDLTQSEARDQAASLTSYSDVETAQRDGKWAVYLGNYESKQSADAVSEKLQVDEGVIGAVEFFAAAGGFSTSPSPGAGSTTTYRVVAGNFASRTEAETLKTNLEDNTGVLLDLVELSGGNFEVRAILGTKDRAEATEFADSLRNLAPKVRVVEITEDSAPAIAPVIDFQATGDVSDADRKRAIELIERMEKARQGLLTSTQKNDLSVEMQRLSKDNKALYNQLMDFQNQQNDVKKLARDATSAMNAGNWVQAEALLRQWKKLEPDSPTVDYMLKDVASKQQPAATAAATPSPEQRMDDLIRNADAAQSQGRYEEAMRLWRELKASPNVTPMLSQRSDDKVKELSDLQYKSSQAGSVSHSGSSSLPKILLVIGGAILGLGIIGGLAMFFMRRKKTPQASAAPAAAPMSSTRPAGGGLRMGNALGGSMMTMPEPSAPTPTQVVPPIAAQAAPPIVPAGATARPTDRIRPGVVFPATPSTVTPPTPTPVTEGANGAGGQHGETVSSDSLQMEDVFAPASLSAPDIAPATPPPAPKEASRDSASTEAIATQTPDTAPQLFTSPPSGIVQTSADEFYTQNFDDEAIGASPSNWKGTYDYAQLVIAERTGGSGKCMKFEKRSGSGSAYYSCRFPDASGRVGIEFDILCMDKNKYLLGFYIEKDEDFRHSVHTVVHKEAGKSDKVLLRLQNQPAPYSLGEWAHVRFLIDLPRHLVDGFVNDKPVVVGERLVSRPKVLNTLSIRDNLATEGVLMIDNIRIYRDR
ncbi:hypothetical protein BH09SUM1_BH09SUM1_04080 [soil metagenome]